jgi:hypothetical protein
MLEALTKDSWISKEKERYFLIAIISINLIIKIIPGAILELGNDEVYYWINKKRRISQDDKVYFITSSQQFFPPDGFGRMFSEIIPRDTLHIFRNGKVVKNLFIYEMKGYKPDTIIQSVNK